MKTFLLSLLILCAATTRANNYYFSDLSGDDSRTSTEAQNPSTPWKTLSKLNASFSDFLPGDSILLKRGEIFYGSLIIDKSGTANAPIFIGAYGTGLNPEITGLMSLTWISAGTNLWKSNEALTLQDALNMVTVNGVPAGMGRWPNLDNGNGGYDSIRSSSSTTITDKPGLTNSPSEGKPSYFIGSEIVVRTKRWLLDRHPITDYNGGNSTITFDKSSSNETPDNNKGYFIQDNSSILDRQDEWWYDRGNKKLKIYSEGAPVNVSAANKENLLISSGKSYIIVDNITFNGCNADAVTTDNGINIVIKNCTIKNAGRNGVKLQTPYCSFLNNTIMDVMSKGILINSSADHTIIQYNTIRNVSQIMGLGTSQQEDGGSCFSGDGVYIRADAATVEHNKFTNMGYSAVHLTKVDSAIIRYNLIDTVCNVYDDGGGIYVYTGGDFKNYGRKIISNIILHGIGAFFGSGVDNAVVAGSGVAGLYNDRGSSDIIEDSNSIAYFEKGLFKNYGSDRVKIRYNTMFDNIKALQINTRLQDQTRGLYITNNIMYSATENELTMSIYSDDGDVLNQLGKIDSNYYARPLNDKTTLSWQSDAGSDPHYVTLEDWRAKYPDYDDHSKKSPQAISDPNKMRFDYNATTADKTISLNGTYIDAKGKTYTNSITLKPFTSAVLLQTSEGDSLQGGPPVVAITSPSDTTFAAPATITITASATDSNGTVTVVKFYNGAALLGTDSTSPYSFSWNNVATGNYVLTAQAIDNDSLVTTSDSVNISVSNAGNSAPAVSITSPSANANFTSPASINISATASDTDGSIEKVDFYSGTTLLATQNTSPYSFSWNNVAAGNYVLTAKATDNGGLVTADSVKITVTNVNGAPTVAITSPSANAGFIAPASITISANAADADGSVAMVSFYKGDSLLSTKNTSPYSFSWNNVAAGNYLLKAKATDNNGLVTVDSVSISVTANGAPTVAITSPAANDNFTAPAAVTISATAADADGSVVKVDFYSGNTLLGTQNASPYTFTWNNVAAGSYLIKVKATDDGGLATADSVTISVANTNGAPTVSITSPKANAAFKAPAAITISATAADTDGSITLVEFYQGSTLLGSDNTSPYSFIWNNVAAGNYVLTAKATDNAGMVTLSDSVNVTVALSGAPTIAITSPAPNAGFIAPASVNIVASAADSNGSISKVEFYNGNTLIGTDNTSPFSFLWKNVAQANYALTARATDNNGLVTTSAALNIYVIKPNIAPAVAITTPVTNTEFATPASVIIRAAASDSDGSIAKVEFFNGAILLKTEYTSPYVFTWKDVAAGKYTLTAKATDNNGRVTLSAPVAISITKPNTAPKVSITNPKTNSSFGAPASISISAAASDSDGSVARVDFYNGNTLIGTDNTNPYSFTWKIATPGNYTLTAKATDNGGKATLSAAVTLAVKPNKAPAVSITSPLTGASFTSPASINISAIASDSDGSIAKVEFFSGTTLLITEYTSPYFFTWKNVSAGNYKLTAKATDNNGLATTSAIVSITVKPNVAPKVSITSPTANTKYKAPASITITAAASDGDGSVAKVNFYNGNTLIGSDISSPYSFTWKNVPKGNYSLIAKATDNGGMVTSSASVNVSVTASGAKNADDAVEEVVLAEDSYKISSENDLNGMTVKIGPNPATGILTIFINGQLKSTKVSLSILSVSGAIIKASTPYNGNRVIQLNVSALIPGLYLVKLQSGNTFINKQFEKQ